MGTEANNTGGATTETSPAASTLTESDITAIATKVAESLKPAETTETTATGAKVITESSEKKDGEGKVIESTVSTITTDANGKVTESIKVTDAAGKVTETITVKETADAIDESAPLTVASLKETLAAERKAIKEEVRDEVLSSYGPPKNLRTGLVRESTETVSTEASAYDPAKGMSETEFATAKRDAMASFIADAAPAGASS